MTLMVLAGCSTDEADEPANVVDSPIEVMSCVADLDEALTVEEAKGNGGSDGNVTRAWTPPAKFSLPDEDKSIGIVFAKNGMDDLTEAAKKKLQGFFFKSSGNWRTTVEIDDAGDYFLYGYTPYTAGVEYSISKPTGEGKDYADGAVMTLDKLPTVTASDLCVVVGAKNGKDNYSAVADYSVTGLRRGDFAYTANKTSGEGSGGNYVYLLFDHLYSCLSIKMKVNGTYNDLRTIKVKSITLKTVDKTDTKPEGTDEKKWTKATVTLNKTASGNDDPIASVVFDSTNKGGYGTVFTSKDGQELTASDQTFTSYFMPQGVTSLVLTTKYDVYDKAATPNLIRANCEATNTLNLGELIDRFEATLRGTRYTINLTIQPTYIYMMSEPDVEFKLSLN